MELDVAVKPIEEATTKTHLTASQVFARWVVSTCVSGVLFWLTIYTLGWLLVLIIVPDGTIMRNIDGLVLLFILASCTLLFFGVALGKAQHRTLPGALGKSWLVASSVGWPLVFASTIACFFILPSPDLWTNPILVAIVGVAIGSMLMAICGWLALPTRIKMRGSPAFWLIVTVAGVTGGMFFIIKGTIWLIEIKHFSSLGLNIVTLTELTLVLVIGLLIYSLPTGLTLAYRTREDAAEAAK